MTEAAGSDALLGLLQRAARGPQRDGLFALWLVARAIEDAGEGLSARGAERRLAALAQRLTSLSVPPPLRRALGAALAQLRGGDLRPDQVLHQLAAPARDTLGRDAGDVLAAAARVSSSHARPTPSPPPGHRR